MQLAFSFPDILHNATTCLLIHTDINKKEYAHAIQLEVSLKEQQMHKWCEFRYWYESNFKLQPFKPLSVFISKCFSKIL